MFSDNGKFFLYNSRSNFYSEISDELYEALQSARFEALPDEVVDQLRAQEIVCEDSEKFDYYYSQLMRFNAANNDPTTLSLVLAPTTACNFACPYCFEEKKATATITPEVIERLVAFVKDHKEAKKVHITWYGDEPLLAFDKMVEIYNSLSADEMPEIASQSIITNGYCIDERVLSFFREKGCSSIQITVDGLGEKHNATRCLRNSDKGTFDTILANIDSILSSLPDTELHIRVNINKNNYRDFVEVFNFFKQKYPDNKKLSIYPGIIREESDDHLSLCASSFGTSERLTLNELLRAEGIDTSDFPRRPTHRGCMAHSSSSFLIGPEGEIYKCWNDVGNPRAVIGNISQSELKNASRLIKYAVQATPFNSECRQYFAFPICDGGCAYHRYRNMFENCHFDLCSPYKDKDRLIKVLLSGKLPS